MQQHASLLAARVTELDLFAGRVAHDVLSPLGTITTALSLLGRSCDERSKKYIDRSQRIIQRTQQLVNGLLAFARSGANPDLTSTCSLDAAIRNIVADCSDTATENGIELSVTITEALQVRCNLGVATSIVQNLIRNAIKYMGASRVRRIEVRAMRVHAMAHLEVEDTGPGIPVDVQPRIFDPFMRGIHADVAGVGLGLATVKRLVESHQGAIGVRSNVGAGTTFWVELPLVHMAAVDGGESSSD
jgi:signal transduction histidine kinase